MKVEVLSVPDCPNHSVAIARVREALAQEHPGCEVREIVVSTLEMARALHFEGSPTIRINGRDVEPNDEGTDGKMCCRLYGGAGAPSVESLRQFIRESREKESL